MPTHIIINSLFEAIVWLIELLRRSGVPAAELLDATSFLHLKSLDLSPPYDLCDNLANCINP